ncbi:MAG TPA: twin-arginine translocation signal domain-containing protein [Ktedonobacterales bacterium]|jgi:hypothetical protein
MPESAISRRTFLAAAGLSVAALGCGIDTIVTGTPTVPAPPSASPFLNGPYQVAKLILGEDVTTVLPQPLDMRQYPDLPPNVHAAVYYPYTTATDHRVPTTDPFSLNGGHIPLGPFPLLLYAHAYRDPAGTLGTPPPARDFTSVEIMLEHVASYGCVAIAPDLSWLLDGADAAANWDRRATVLVAYYQFLLSTLNYVLFENQVDPSRVILVGHSRGGGGATHAGRMLLASSSPPRTLAFGLIAPEYGGDTGPDTQNLVVLGGTLDIDEGAEPQLAFMRAGTPKTWVTIQGANHYGYTSICPADNSCDSVRLFDENGTISRAAQQLTGASYLAALLRYYALGDGTALPYLNGQQPVQGLEVLNVSGITIQQQGLPTPLPPVHP